VRFFDGVGRERRRGLAELEPSLRERLLALDEPVTWDDWADVVRRSRSSRPWVRHTGALAAVSGVVVALSAAAFAFTPGLSSLIGVGGSAARLAPERQGSAPSGAATGPVLAPAAIVSETRVISALRLSGAGDRLYVSPTRQGGFCYKWSGGAGGCELRPAPLGVAWGGGRVVGAVSSADVSSVKITFTDGTSAEPEISWVAAPINAGFFLYDIPAGKTVAEVTANDGSRTRGRVPWYSV
jgi:hypothetical protein